MALLAAPRYPGHTFPITRHALAWRVDATLVDGAAQEIVHSIHGPSSWFASILVKFLLLLKVAHKKVADMKKLLNVTTLLFAFYSTVACADTLYLSVDGAARSSEQSISYRLKSAGYQVAPFSALNGQSGPVLHMVSVVDINTTGQGNMIANHGGSATVIYICQTKTARIPIFIGDQATTGVSLGYEANNMQAQSGNSLVQIAVQVLKRSSQKIEEWANYCAEINTLEEKRSEPQPKKKKN